MADGTTFPPYSTIPALNPASSLNYNDQIWINQAGVDVRANLGDVAHFAPAAVTAFNGRTGAISLTLPDITGAGGVPIVSPVFQGVPQGPTAAIGSATGQLATTQFVANALAAASPGVASFNNRTGAVSLTALDLTGVGGALSVSPAFLGQPTTPTAPPGTSTTQIASTAFVANAVASAVVPGVSSFNNRTGAVSLALSDVTGVGGAPLSSPVMVGVPQAPTAAPGTSTTQIATTAFVQASVASGVAGVASFNGRVGAVTLTTADLTAAGGATAAQLSIYAPINAPTFTGVPSGPTALSGTATTQLATCQFVSQALASVTGVTSFNTRQGAVTLTAGDVTGVGGALLASPVFTGAPQAPTPAAADNSTSLATTAWVMTKIAGVPQGTVTSVGLALPGIFSVSGSPVTASGVLTGALVNQNAGAVFAGPATGSPAAPGFRPLQQTDISAIAVTAFNGRTGSVSLTAADVAAVGVSSFNTRIGAVTLSQADVSAVAVGSFKVRTGAVTLTAADVSAAGGPYATTAALTAGYLPLAGGTLTGGIDITGVFSGGALNNYALSIDTTGTGSWIRLNPSSAIYSCGIQGFKGGLQRWTIWLGDGSAESGSNSGSNLVIGSFTDAGAGLASPLTINRATGNATFSGQIYVNGASNGGLSLSGAAGSQRVIYLETNNIVRWGIMASQGAESGSNAGSDFNIVSFTDAGAYIGSPLVINRATGNATFSGTLACAAPPNGNPPTSGTTYPVCGYVQVGNWYNSTLAAVRNDGLAGLFWYNGGNQFTWSGSTSDRRVKSNIKPAKSALGIVNDMSVYDLDYTPRFKTAEGYSEHVPERWPFSFIADEVAKILPHATIKSHEDDGEHHVALHPHHLVAVLWKAAQELSAKVDTLTAQVEALQAQAGAR